MIPKSAEQQSINRHNGQRQEREDEASESYQVKAPVTHRYPKIQ